MLFLALNLIQLPRTLPTAQQTVWDGECCKGWRLVKVAGLSRHMCTQDNIPVLSNFNNLAIPQVRNQPSEGWSEGK